MMDGWPPGDLPGRERQREQQVVSMAATAAPLVASELPPPANPLRLGPRALNWPRPTPVDDLESSRVLMSCARLRAGRPARKTNGRSGQPTSGLAGVTLFNVARPAPERSNPPELAINHAPSFISMATGVCGPLIAARRCWSCRPPALVLSFLKKFAQQQAGEDSLLS